MDAVHREIADLLDSLVAAYVAKDVKTATELLSDDAVIVGTGRDELCFGREEVMTQIERGTSQADELALAVRRPPRGWTRRGGLVLR